MSTDNKLADALHVLLAACDDSDSAMYGTLGVSFVRDVAQAALAEHDAQPAQPAPAPVQPSSVSTPIPNTGTYFAQPPAPGEADEFDKPAMELTALRKKLAAAEDAAKSAGEAESIMLFEIERMYQESRATLIRAAIAALQQRVTPLALPELMEEDVVVANRILYSDEARTAPANTRPSEDEWDLIAMRAALESYRARLMAKEVPND